MRKRLSGCDRIEAMWRYLAGHGLVAIGQTIGFSHVSVQRNLDRMGIARRAPGPVPRGGAAHA